MLGQARGQKGQYQQDYAYNCDCGDQHRVLLGVAS
jgi:hypothetical protein